MLTAHDQADMMNMTTTMPLANNPIDAHSSA
jgi:hypothetical protein